MSTRLKTVAKIELAMTRVHTDKCLNITVDGIHKQKTSQRLQKPPQSCKYFKTQELGRQYSHSTLTNYTKNL